jgi:uncharacterized protein (TIGR00255 family)
MSFPRSMTGFGRGDYTGENGWSVEIKSVNHRFCDIRIKMSHILNPLEDQIKKLVANSFSRGHVDVVITSTGTGQGSSKLVVNQDLSQEYHDCLKSLAKDLDLPSTDAEVLRLVATYPQVIISEKQEQDIQGIWQSLQPAIESALTESTSMREDEGHHLKNDLSTRLDDFGKVIHTIEAVLPELLEQRKKNLEEKIDKLLNGIDLDPMRLAQEVVILTDKADVTEEVVRLNSHIDQFQAFLNLEEPVGRRLDFLLQEFLREINTLASKITSSSIAHQTVALKSEIEKMREQVQNLE